MIAYSDIRSHSLTHWQIYCYQPIIYARTRSILAQWWPKQSLKLKVAPAQIREIFLWAIISKTWPRIIMSNIGLLESVTFQLHDRMLSSFCAVIRYEPVSDLGVRSLSVTTILKKVDFWGKTNTAIHGPHLYGVGSFTARSIYPNPALHLGSLIRSLIPLRSHYLADQNTDNTLTLWHTPWPQDYLKIVFHCTVIHRQKQ